MTENAVHSVASRRPTPNTVPEYQGFTRQLQEVIKQMTGWKVWTSDAGALYATRVQDLTEAERKLDLAQTVGADTPLQLVEAIQQQLRKSLELTAHSVEPQALKRPAGF